MTLHGWLTWACAWHCSWPSFRTKFPFVAAKILIGYLVFLLMAEVIFKGGWDGGFVLSPFLGISSIHGRVNICKPNVKSQTEDFIKSIICFHLAAYRWLQKSSHTIFFQKFSCRLRSIWRKKIFLCYSSLNSCKDGLSHLYKPQGTLVLPGLTHLQYWFQPPWEFTDLYFPPCFSAGFLFNLLLSDMNLFHVTLVQLLTFDVKHFKYIEFLREF